MIEEEIVALYKKTKKQLAALLDDMTFANFYRALQSGKRSYLLRNTKTTKGIDEDWVNAIMDAIPNIDSIINNPRKYMKRETDVVPIEKARLVDSESVQHLAAHTNYINSVENGFVKPNKILSAYNEESLELYENRFVATLITRASQFIDRRYFLLGTGGKEFSSTIQADGSFEQSGEETDYSLSMTVKQGADYFDGGVSSAVYENLFTIRKYVNSFKYSPFMKIMNSFGQVRPPIIKTNLLTKEPNYHACLKLWDFIESYDKAGYKIEIEESAPLLARELIDDFDAINMIQYIALKKKMGDFDPRRRAMTKCNKRVLKPLIEDFASNDEVSLEIGGSGYNGRMFKKDNRDKDNMIKDVLLRALRKEAIKRELEEKEKLEREKKLGGALKNAMDKQAALAEERSKRNKELEQTIREALKEESLKAKEKMREEMRRAQPAMRALKRQLNKIESNDAMQREAARLEAKQNDELMQAVLNDLLRIEEEREYIRTSPLIIKGGENMPVPVMQQRLPATKDTANMFSDLFTPPVRVEPQDWEDFKANRKKKRNRFSEEDLENAICQAIDLERKRERRLRQQEQAEAAAREKEKLRLEQAERDKQAEIEERMEREFSEELRREREKIEKELSDENERQKEVAATGGESGEDKSDSSSKTGNHGKSGNDNNSGGHKNWHGGNDSEEIDKNRAIVQSDEEHIGFWRRLFRKIFFWWHKK